MTYPQRPVDTATARHVSAQPTGQWTARRSPFVPATAAPVAPLATQTRRFEAMSLLPNGDISELAQRGPAHPIFESAFAALARGTILATDAGPVAVEDLVPGVMIETRDDGFQPLMWIGSMTIGPNMPLADFPARLFRVPVDSFGPSRPMPDLMLAPHARLLQRSPKLREQVGSDVALSPIAGFEDGYSVIRVAPASPVTVYHLGFRSHQILRANGLEIESFHPGPEMPRQISHESLRLFMSFFPHLTSVSEFGPLVAPRMTVEQAEELRAG